MAISVRNSAMQIGVRLLSRNMQYLGSTEIIRVIKVVTPHSPLSFTLAVGSLTNPTWLANTFQSVKGLNIKNETISTYLDCFIDAYILGNATSILRISC